MFAKKLGEVEINTAGVEGDGSNGAVGMYGLPGVGESMGGAGCFDECVRSIKEIGGNLFVQGRVSGTDHEGFKTNGRAAVRRVASSCSVPEIMTSAPASCGDGTE